MTEKMLKDIEESIALADQCRCDIDNGERQYEAELTTETPLNQLPGSIIFGTVVGVAYDLLREVRRLREIEKEHLFPEYIEVKE